MSEEINLRDYEIVSGLDPLPNNLTPREYVLRMTGKDLDVLKHPNQERDFTWDEVKATGADAAILKIVMTCSTTPRLVLRKKTL